MERAPGSRHPGALLSRSIELLWIISWRSISRDARTAELIAQAAIYQTKISTRVVEDILRVDVAKIDGGAVEAYVIVFNAANQIVGECIFQPHTDRSTGAPVRIRTCPCTADRIADGRSHVGACISAPHKKG